MPEISIPFNGTKRGMDRPTLGWRRIASLMVAQRNGSWEASEYRGGELSFPEDVALSI